MTFEDYFQAYKDYFWVWEDQAEVVSITGGSTIAYREFILATLESLSAQGLPPFGALLLAIVATNQSPGGHKEVPYFGSLEGRRNTPLTKIKEIILGTVGNDPYNEKGIREALEEALSFLDLLPQLPPSCTTGPKRIQLFQVLFADCHNMVSASKSQTLLQEAQKVYTDSPGDFVDRLARPIEYSYSNFYKDFRCIGLLGKKFPDVDSLIKGLINVPVIKSPILLPAPAALVEEPSKPEPEDLVSELINNPKTFLIGSLIKRIWSGLNIPVHHNLPSSQPLGGISDLTNKGDYDKLLISEFANEDLVFLSRLANNEALYLHRETPPHADDQERILLLDISLRNWGTPKVLAYAILLAIAKHPKTDIHCTAFAIGQSYYPLGFDTVGQLIDSIQLLDDSLHSAGGLERFFREYKPAKKPEIIFIASADSFRQAALQNVISHHRADFNYWITTDPEGNIELYKNQRNNRKLVQHLQLPLEALWKREEKSEERGADDENANMGKHPLLYPVPLSIKHVLAKNDGWAFAFAGRKKLFRSAGVLEETAKHGWELILDNVPAAAKDCALGWDEKGNYLLLCFNANNREITVINLVTLDRQTGVFNDWKSSEHPSFFFHDKAFYYVGRQICWRIEFHPTIRIQQEEVIERIDLIIIHNQQVRDLETVKRKINLPSYQGIKNISSVFINGSGNLVIGKHELIQDMHGHIRFELSGIKYPGPSDIRAQPDVIKNNFSFADGSTVTVDPSGMLLLKSRWPDRYDVVLQNRGANTLSVIKTVKESLDIGLKEARDLVEREHPSTIASNKGVGHANNLQAGLIGAGAEAKLEEHELILFIPCALYKPLGVATHTEFAGNDYYYRPGSTLKKIDTKDFFDNNIGAFIRKIQAYGTTT